METTQSVETVRDFEFVEPVMRCQQCKNLFKLEDLNLNIETGKGTCDSCVGPYKA